MRARRSGQPARYDVSMAVATDNSPSTRHRAYAVFTGGAAVGLLGGLIGLGGAEFRLPLLVSLFGFAALQAVILNKAMSLVVVTTALVSRTGTISLSEIASHWTIIATLLSGSVVGAWLGADTATRLSARALYRIIAALLLGMAFVLVLSHGGDQPRSLGLTGPVLTVVGLVCGLLIGAIASFLGVAGGELLIPTIVLLFGAPLTLAGSLSLAISLPTMLVGFARYSRDRSFEVLSSNLSFVAWMSLGSLVGAALGGYLVGIVPTALLLPTLAAVLVVSAWRVWRHT